MTSIEKSFGYYVPPERNKLEAVNLLRNVYGIRRLSFNETPQYVSVEYATSRLNEDEVVALFREAGVRLFPQVVGATNDAHS